MAAANPHALPSTTPFEKGVPGAYSIDMDYVPASPEPLPPPVVAFRKKGQPLLAWLVILALVAFVLWRNFRASSEGGIGEVGYTALEMQGRFLVGLAQLQRGVGNSKRELAAQVASLNTGPVGQRLRAIILLGELDGPEEALQQLDALERMNLNPAQRQALEILRKLYRDYRAGDWAASSVTDTERAVLRERLGWFGALALTPEKGPDSAAREEVLTPARRALAALFGLGAWFLIFGIAGLIGLILFVALLLKGRLRLRLETGSPAGGVYAETFAVWMALFLALSYGAAQVSVGGLHFLVMGAAMLLSLAALAWPLLRGLSWQQVRQELGLTAGPRPGIEPIAGVATYAMALPLLLIGVLLMLLLLRLQASFPRAGGGGQGGGMPSHPIAETVGHLDWWGCLQVLVLASVVAPIVEETMFRGVLYRHLREASAQLGRLFSVLLSATVVSFLFAVIHPQGLVAVPALMALAFAFALAREWRGTLLPAMVAHGINNAVVFVLLITAMSS
jgi:membrane protease YdiL (CAAX protease family)